ncbi:MAG: pyridoxal-phosphate dependent enzyme [Candidatus Eisenbacteria bacterium]|uniref:Pyridoxal-phosphate dependent enzyme n=1 Tax=Eiseniibacteriota bacterium TaxID=2212470 RepID=A0A538TRN5_UNCEI|nr:MAG: pyridoxal-phosphate dependent enzyme [Candidatus Eisenbacteria bacterium]
MRPLEAPRLEEIRAARERIASTVLRTPLVRLQADDAPAEIHLKLENLQPIGSFKLRGAANAMRLHPRDALARGVYTASAGNMAQGVAWNARLLGVPCAVVVPEHAPRTKLDAIERLGARIVKVPFDVWWSVLVERSYPGMEGLFIHPVSDLAVIAGHGTIGLEILEDLPDVDAILVPYGGGGLSSGIAAAARALKPGVKIFACEVATAAPFAASLAAGSPRSIEHRPSFVDGIGGKSLLAEMWPMVRELLAGSITVEVAEAAAAVRLLVERNRVVAEGAGAVPVAAALTGRAGPGTVACVVSGGNIDAEKLAKILAGGIP